MPVATPRREITDVSEAQTLEEPYTLMVNNPTVANPEDVFPVDMPIGVVIYRIEGPEYRIVTGDFPRWTPMHCFDIVGPEGVTQSTASTEIIPGQILDRLDYLAGLPENWDGEGATAVTEFTINRIKGLLRRAYFAAGVQIPIPFISPAHDGMLVVEWKTETGKELILDVPPDETPPGFLLVEPSPSGDEYETDAEIGDEWPIERAIQHLLAN